MNKIFTLLIAFTLFSNLSYSQIADGSVAADFTAEDINGVEHNLYDLLGQGKTVILDVFATWCPPCWSYHNQHILEEIYNDFGPDGTDEIYVFAIEGDATTRVECLYGNTDPNCGSSLGDWTDGISYPIIDSRQIAEDYKISYFPTLFMVFPNREVYEMGQRDRAGVIDFKESGPVLEAGVHPILLDSEVLEGSICGTETTSPSYTVFNQGTDKITSGDISVTYNGNVLYEEAWTGEADSWSMITEVALDEIEVSENSVIEFRMDNINGDASNQLVKTSDIVTNVTNSITVEIVTDANSPADNNQFLILSMFGKTIGSEMLDEPNKAYKFEYVLDDLICHFFSITDTRGDGINGVVKITDSQNRVIFDNADFGSGAEVNFNASMNSGLNQVLQNVSMSIAPNPVSDILTVELNLEQSKSLGLTMTAVDGTTVLTQKLGNLTSGKNTTQLDIANLPSGIYFLSVQNEEGRLTSRVIKQ